VSSLNYFENINNPTVDDDHIKHPYTEKGVSYHLGYGKQILFLEILNTAMSYMTSFITNRIRMILLSID